MTENTVGEKSVNTPASIRRRDLLRGGVAASLGTLMGFAMQNHAEAGESNDGYIDAHSHVWSRDVKRFPLADGRTVDDLQPTSFTPLELMAVARPVGVTRVVLIQHDVFHAFDNSYLIHVAAEQPDRFRVVGKLNHLQPHADRSMRELLPRQVTSFRITSRFPSSDRWLEGPGMASMWACAAETRQSLGCLIDAQDLPAVDAMCAKFPETPVVIDHFARIGVDGEIRDMDVRNLCRLARHMHTYVKLSAYYALGKKRPPYDDLAPMIRQLLDAFGPERLMWASDSPYQLDGDNTYAESIALIRDRLDFISASDRLWLLRKTAEKVYWL